jgi:AAA family ATP:ADP antiporter
MFIGLMSETLGIDKRSCQRAIINSLMMFLIVYVYTTLRIFKDVIVLEEASGASSISFLKTYFTFPAALMLSIFYGNIVKLLSRSKVFYFFLTLFFIYYSFYTFVIKNNPEDFHLNIFRGFVQNLDIESLPQFLKFIKIFFLGIATQFDRWSSTLFYILAELWGTLFISVLFWLFSNETLPSHEEKKALFPLYTLASGISTIASVEFINAIARDYKGQEIIICLQLCLVSIVIISILFSLSIDLALKDDRLQYEDKPTSQKEDTNLWNLLQYTWNNYQRFTSI